MSERPEVQTGAGGESSRAAVTSWSRTAWALYRQRGMGSPIGFGMRPAVLVIDMSKAFTDPSYSVGAEQSSAIEAIARLLEAARPLQMPTFFTTLAYEDDSRDAGAWTKKVPALLDLSTSDPAAVTIDERIAPIEGEIVINKKYPSAFFGTPLPSLLVTAGVDTVILAGCSTSGCIRASAVDAVSYGYRVIVPEECVADRAEDPHYANLFDINAKYGDVVPLADVIDHLNSMRPQPTAGVSSLAPSR